MSCTSITLTGIALDCGNVGGISEFYMVDILDVSGFTFSGETMQTISMVSGKKFKKYSINPGNANFQSAPTKNDQNDTLFYTTTTTAVFNKMDASKRAEMNALGKGKVYVIVKDNNDTYWFIGYGSYNSAAPTASTGANWGDANKYDLVLTAITKETPMVVASGAISSIV